MSLIDVLALVVVVLAVGAGWLRARLVARETPNLSEEIERAIRQAKGDYSE
jgi:hypothetical protein